MTEEKWLTSADPAAMLDFMLCRESSRFVGWLRTIWSGRAFRTSHRKFQLLARAIRRHQLDLPGAMAIEHSDPEQFIARTQILDGEDSDPDFVYKFPWFQPAFMLPHVLESGWADELGGPGLRASYCPLFRDIIGNPFRPATVNPAWLEWNGGTVVKLAKTIYDDRHWELMPLLGDALEDALCDNADMINHCRGPGPHARGCWVVDLILGKK